MRDVTEQSIALKRHGMEIVIAAKEDSGPHHAIVDKLTLYSQHC